MVGVNKACPSVPIRALTDQRLWARAELGTTYVRRGGRFGKERVPPEFAVSERPSACESEMGGTGEGVKRWERLGREEERKRICEAPESGI